MAIIKIRNAAIDLDAAEIPNLPASKITSGTFANNKLTGSGAITINGSSVALGASTTIATGLSWQSTIVTASTLAAVSGNGYWINTTSNACTITLPSNPSLGDEIVFVDYARNWGTNAITINQNSKNFQGSTSVNPNYNTNGQSVSIVYSDATKGWIPTTDDDVKFTVSPPYAADFLVIAGGGGGGHGYAGGGGAGGYRNSYASETSGGGGSTESDINLSTGSVYTITVGDGGAKGGSYQTFGTPGGVSSIVGDNVSITTVGGGKGGYNANSNQSSVLGGGSGGGGGSATSSYPAGAGTANQGYAGGAGDTNGTGNGGGGGGGAGAVGVAYSGTAGNGGNGLASSITGSSVTRAGGGGAGSWTGQGSTASGGSGGGGTGANNTQNAGNGTTNTGSGGGGGGQSAGNGGSGVVILRMATSNYSGTTTGSPTVSTSGSDTILIFNASGSYTA